MFRYEEYYAENRFSFFIKKIWVLDNMDGLLAVSGKSVLPNGCFNIAVVEGKGLAITHKGWQKQLHCGSYFCGQMTEAVSVHIAARTRATMLQLHPWVPAHFTQADMSQFTDRIVSLKTIEVNALLADRLPGMTPQAIYQALVQSYAPLLEMGAVSQLVYKGASTILDSEGTTTVAGLASGLGCSQRHLQKIFKRHIGLSPKQLSLIIRLRAAVDALAYPGTEKVSMAALAVDSSFYDQAHFINAFRSFAKTSPKKISIADYFLSFKK